MVIAKIQWSNENGYEQEQPTTTKSVKHLATTIVEAAVISTLAEKPITTAVRMMTTAIAAVENDILAATTTPTTTTTTTTTTSTSTHMTPNTDKTLNSSSYTNDLIVSENDIKEKVEEKLELERELETSEICDKTDKLLLEDVKTTTVAVTVKENDEEQLMKTLNVNNNNNNNIVVVNNDDMNMLECESNTNTLQNTTTNIGLSNNWLMTEQNGQPQTTESFLSGLGVDISSLSKTLNLPQTTASKLYALNDELNTISKTSTSVTLSKGNNNNNNTFDLTANNAVVSENGQAKIILLCESNSHPFQARTIMLTPNIECKVGRLIAKSKASETNAIFDCKVLSRNHAVLWYTPEDQKFWVKDTKSSNGTFINDQKLGNEAAELHFGDVVKFGVDVVENSRKEVHGCIIASVKLYLPDGREAISADALHNGRSAYSGEKCITYDELHRLNLYVQEVSNREKNLKSKLFNIQNLLDATRKNSGLCWQALIAEDQLLHRIHMLEKKLQVMEKNVPESSLRSEVIKLLEDKNLYQQQAKETLQKVYQERCEALQLHAKTEAAHAQAESECKLLREQVMTGKQTLQEVSNRLLQLETEYIEFKEEVQRQQQEEKEEETARSLALTKLLHEREMECEDLKNKLSLLMMEAANKYQEEVARLDELKAVEKIDAAIADMDLDDDDDEDEDDEEDDGVGDADELDKLCYNDEFTNKSASYNGVDVVQLNNSKNERKLAENGEKINDNTIMKWLKNSDLNKKEGSSDIMKAICNESDSSDEADAELLPAVKKSKSLQSAYNSLLELEKNISQELETDAQQIIEHVKPPAYDEAKKPFVQLKESVALLRTVYNEIIIAQEQGEKRQLKLEPQLTLKEEEEAETAPSEKNTAEIALLQEKLKSYEADWQNNMELLQGEKESYKQKVLELTQQVEKLCEEKQQALEQNQTETAASASASETPISSTATTPTRSTVTPAHEEFHDDEILTDMLMDNSAVEREEELIMYKENLEQTRLVNSELRREMNELQAKFDKHILAGGGVAGPAALCTSRVLLRYILPYGAAAAVAVLCWLSTYF